MSAVRNKKGFTLIEILIVVIILGILAAIVIPQFTNASTAAKQSSEASTAQTVRSQIQLYKLDHNDTLPPAATFWTALTTQTDDAGAAYVAGTSTSGPHGPYMQATPVNPLNNLSSVADGVITTKLSSTSGWIYDYTGGTGRFVGTATDGETPAQ